MNNLDMTPNSTDKKPRFHVSPHDKKIRPCEAKVGECRFLNESEHFFSQEEVDNYIKGSNPTISTVKKNQSSESNQTLILSDVDGTLVKGSLVLQHAVDLHESGFIDLGELPNQWVKDKKNEDLVTELANQYRLALVGEKLDGIRVKETMDRLFNAEGSFYSTLDRLVKSKQEGARVVLISGSPSYLVEALAKKFGFEFSASKFHTDNDNSFNGGIDLMATAEAKHNFISTLNTSEYGEIVGVGDTVSDFPLFDASHRAILVAPSVETIEKAINLDKKLDEIVYH